MGTTSTALFSDDVACDVRDEFLELLRGEASSIDATQSLVRTWAAEIQDDDDGPVFWLALAATQWKYGCLTPAVQARAIEVIEGGANVRRWEGRAAARRNAVLLALKEQLLSTQPKLRRPARRKPVVVASTKVIAPDGRAQATAYELAPTPLPAAPRMQVLVEMEASGSRGGGGVFVADCEYTEVALNWVNSNTLQITYPGSAVVSNQSASLFYYGRIIQIEYAAKSV